MAYLARMGLLSEQVASSLGSVTALSIVMVGVEMHTSGILASCVPTHPGPEPLARPCLKTTSDNELSACPQISPPLPCHRCPKLPGSLPCESASPRMWDWPEIESPLFDCTDRENTWLSERGDGHLPISKALVPNLTGSENSSSVEKVGVAAFPATPLVLLPPTFQLDGESLHMIGACLFEILQLSLQLPKIWLLSKWLAWCTSRDSCQWTELSEQELDRFSCNLF